MAKETIHSKQRNQSTAASFNENMPVPRKLGAQVSQYPDTTHKEKYSWIDENETRDAIYCIKLN